ncbi:MAG: pyrroline-5-carboxylate reductase [SAR324 cluster bacterium]|nr:pyrroline-5-carboxylate reductase [SAR324 cluster bacterium]
MGVAIIGGGNMGRAIAHSLLHTQTFLQSDILVVETVSAKCEQLVDTIGCRVLEKIGAEISQFTGVIVAVKPQMSSSVMEELASFLASHQLVISIMAGISTRQMVQTLNHEAIVRVMPNTPSQIGEGMSVYFATPTVNQEQLEFTKKILKATGQALAVKNEDAIDAATAISGSGPAYIFYIAEQMVASARQLGFSEDEATLLVQQTIKGAVLLWEKQEISAGELRQQVTSPGGTTESALQTFTENKIDSNFQQGLQSAYQRAKELAQNS